MVNMQPGDQGGMSIGILNYLKVMKETIAKHAGYEAGGWQNRYGLSGSFT